MTAKARTLSASLDDVAAGLDLEPNAVAELADAGELVIVLDRLPSARSSLVPVTTDGKPVAEDAEASTDARAGAAVPIGASETGAEPEPEPEPEAKPAGASSGKSSSKTAAKT